jgi:hypothetical protein
MDLNPQIIYNVACLLIQLFSFLGECLEITIEYGMWVHLLPAETFVFIMLQAPF